MTRYHLTLKSENKKTGPIPVSMTSSETCPSSCGQFRTCYAKYGHMKAIWKKHADQSGTDLSDFCLKIKSLPSGQVWRHNQAGDLPGVGERINARALRRIVSANKGRHGFTFTHKPMSQRNISLVKEANRRGFVVNISADTIQQADRYRSINAGPVVVVLPEKTTTSFTTPGGNRVVLCPNVTHGVTCERCKLCAWSEREVIIGFPAHGAERSKVGSSGMFPIVGQE
jgi:hypothetical protein